MTPFNEKNIVLRTYGIITGADNESFPPRVFGLEIRQITCLSTVIAG